MRRGSENIFRSSRTEEESVLPLYNRSHENTSSYDSVFRQIAGTPMDRFDRWTDRIENTNARRAASTLAFMTKPTPFLIGTASFWAILYFSKAFNQLEVDPVSVFAMMIVGSLITTVTLWLARGSKRPDYSGFQNYMTKLSEIPSLPKFVTTPAPNSFEEQSQCIDWHIGFINFVASGDDAEGILEAVKHILDSVRTFFNADVSDTESHDTVYDMKLLEHTKSKDEKQSNLAAPEKDSFLTASVQEKRTASRSDWHTMQTKPLYERINIRYFEGHILSQVSRSYIHRSALRDSSRGRDKAVIVLAGLLQSLVTDPFKDEHPESSERNVKKALQNKCFHLITILRPAMSDGQWGNWRYFYANDPIVTKAFRRLSTQQQVWMIYTLMLGSDHGKLLALSILQDPKLPTSTLSQFFRAYLAEYGGITLERAEELYQEVYGKKSASRQELVEHQHYLVNEFRLQLAWLTENSAGQMTPLFEEDPILAAKILQNFTVELDQFPSEAVKHTYAIPPEKSPELEPVDVEFNEKEYEAKPLKQDGSFGFSVFGRTLKREKIVQALLPMIQVDDAVFKEARGSNAIDLNARKYLEPEIFDLLTNLEFETIVPKIFTERPMNGVEMVNTLHRMREVIRDTYNDCRNKVPSPTRETIKGMDALIAYYADENKPLEGVDNEKEYRTVGHSTLERLFQEYLQVVEQLHDFCQRPDVVEAYLRYGVGFHLPLGARTVALFAASQDYQVEGFEANGRNLTMVMRHTSPNKPVFRLVIGKRWCDWAKLRAKPIRRVEPFRMPMSASRQQSHIEEDTFVFPLDSHHASRHPFIQIAQSLYWSVGDSGKQQYICEGMDYGHKDRTDIRGHLETARLLYVMDSPQNKLAIKKGILQSSKVRALCQKSIEDLLKEPNLKDYFEKDKLNELLEKFGSLECLLQEYGGFERLLKKFGKLEKVIQESGNLEALLPKIRDKKTRRSALAFLAELLSDPVDGLEYQHSFQKLVIAHRSEFCNDEKIRDFLEWLDELRPQENIKPDMVRARFAAVIVMETENQYQLESPKRAARLEHLIRFFYPNEDLLTALDHMRPAFDSDAEWVVRRLVFQLIFNTRMLNRQPEADQSLEFLSQDEKTDMLPIIRNAFSGDIRTDLEAQERIISWGDFLSSMVSNAYPRYNDYINNIIDELCGIIQDRNTPEETSQHLSLVLLSTIDLIPPWATSENKLEKYESMYKVLTAWQTRLGRTIETSALNLSEVNDFMVLLRAIRYKTHHSNNNEMMAASIEAIFTHIAGFLMSHALSTRETNVQESQHAMAQSRALLSQVVESAAAYRVLITLDRPYIGNYLASLIDENEYDVGKGNSAAHRELIHRIVYLLFKDVEFLSLKDSEQLTQLSSQFMDACKKVGNQDSAVGIKRLFDSVCNNVFLKTHFENDLKPAAYRMVALLLSKIYKEMPTHYRLSYSNDSESLNVQREHCVNNMKSVLDELELCDPTINNQINTTFAPNSQLRQAFIEIGMESTAKFIANAIIKDNNKKANTSEQPATPVLRQRKDRGERSHLVGNNFDFGTSSYSSIPPREEEHLSSGVPAFSINLIPHEQ